MSANSHRPHSLTALLLAIAGLGVAGGFLLRFIGYGEWTNGAWATRSFNL